MSRAARIAWLATGSVLTVGTLVYGTGAAVSALAHERSVERQTVEGTITTVDVRQSAGKVRIVAGPAGSATVVSGISEGLTAPDRDVHLDGTTLVVRGSCLPVINVWCGLDLDLTVPADASVVVRTSGGGITVQDLRGDLDLSSSGGGIRATGLTSARTLARSSAGGVNLSYASPPTWVDTSSRAGSVTVVVPRTDDAYRVDASSSAGSADVLVRTDPSGSRAIGARSSAGDVTVRYPDG